MVEETYQDTPGLAMWCDLVMGPARVKSGRRLFAFFRKTLRTFFSRVGLGPNSPIKAHIRKERCAKLYDYF